MSKENESGVLGSCLCDDTAMDKCLNAGCISDWFTGINRTIFAQIYAMHLADEPIDLITVGQKLDGKNGITYQHLNDLADGCMTAEFCEHYLKLLERDYKCRRITETIRQDLSNLEPEQAISKLSEELTAIVSKDDDKTVGEAMDDNIHVMNNACEGVVSGLPLPWERFSNHTGGIQRGSVCPFVGRDGKGKSGALAQILDHWAGLDIPVLAFSFEDVKRRTLLRMGGCREWYSARTAETGRALLNGKWERIALYERQQLHEKMLRYKSFIESKPFWIVDQPMTVEEVCYLIKHHHRVNKIQAVTIDGFKDIVHSEGENETSKEKHIAKMLFRVAKECNLAIPVISHIHKIDDDKAISKMHIMGSSVQFQGARQVMILQDAGVPGVDGETTYELNMTKSNYGGGGAVLLRRDEHVLHYKEV